MAQGELQQRDRRTTLRLLAGAGLVVLVGGFAAIVFAGRSDEASPRAEPGATTPGTTTPGTTTPSKTPPKPKSVRVPVEGIGAYDPDGDQSENDSAAPLATDGVLSTAWKTENYRSTFSKTGVGLVLDAGRPVKANRLVVVTETPGFTADVRVGSSATGPYVSVSNEQSLKARTTFALKPRSGRYLMLWVTSIPDDDAAAANEITVSAAG